MPEILPIRSWKNEKVASAQSSWSARTKDCVGRSIQISRARRRSSTKLRPFLFEPGPADVLGSLLPHYLNFQVYQILLEAKASEHSSRMVAMKNATDNAKQLVKDLTLEYNKLRQANITKELLEITTAQMALG